MTTGDETSTPDDDRRSRRDRDRRRRNVALTLSPAELDALDWLVSYHQSHGAPALEYAGRYSRSGVVGRLLLSERSRLDQVSG